ncbi:MAG: hypothetical protein LBI99_07680, partial [Propionibacteriaceae bacterium]|nr:hypothetical protein [Propionibacteriaceae bacterium]
DSGYLTLWDAQGKQELGADLAVPASDDASRVLYLAQPDDPRWQVSVGGQTLEKLGSATPEQRYGVGMASGELSVVLRPEPQNWAWVQLVGLLFLIGLALPGLQKRNTASVGRRLNRPLPGNDENEVLPRRALEVAE